MRHRETGEEDQEHRTLREEEEGQEQECPLEEEEAPLTCVSGFENSSSTYLLSYILSGNLGSNSKSDPLKLIESDETTATLVTDAFVKCSFIPN